MNTKISICICTYRRNKGLSDLLESILKQEFENNYSISINVVDNASPPTSENLVNLFKKRTSYKINWTHEKKQGISYARNTSVLLSADSDFFFFVDDDQILDKNCINELVNTIVHYKANLVYGSNPPVFERKITPLFIKEYFYPKKANKGDRLEFAATNCLLAERKVLISDSEEPFDIRFAHTGGEDTFLTRKLVKNGSLLIKTPNAIAYEIIPESRCNVKWILTRVLRESAIFSFQSILLKESIIKISIRILKLLIKFLIGIIVLLPIALLTKKNKLYGIIMIFDSIGGLLGFLSFQKKAY